MKNDDGKVVNYYTVELRVEEHEDYVVVRIPKVPREQYSNVRSNLVEFLEDVLGVDLLRSAIRNESDSEVILRIGKKKKMHE